MAITNTINAAGNSQGTATQIGNKHRIGNVYIAGGTGGVALPVAPYIDGPEMVTIWNASGASVTVYPQGTGTINGSTTYTIANGERTIFQAFSSIDWGTVKSA